MFEFTVIPPAPRTSSAVAPVADRAAGASLADGDASTSFARALAALDDVTGDAVEDEDPDSASIPNVPTTVALPNASQPSLVFGWVGAFPFGEGADVDGKVSASLVDAEETQARTENIAISVAPALVAPLPTVPVPQLLLPDTEATGELRPITESSGAEAQAKRGLPTHLQVSVSGLPLAAAGRPSVHDSTTSRPHDARSSAFAGHRRTRRSHGGGGGRSPRLPGFPTPRLQVSSSSP